ncbi:peroxiredoxin family protein [Emticicia sp. SJ17W-69]|uniref:peroxiredoxin family protein n=1 Tax=Emticicia sp. SJ17W-69 TaxID=3421657 RepID=UPI003EC017FD
MRKYLKILIAIILLGGICILSFGIMKSIQKKKEVFEKIKNLPIFSFQTLDNKIFSKKDVLEDKNILLIAFNPDCDFCQAEAEHIKNDLSILKPFQILMVSPAKADSIKKFALKYGLADQENIQFLIDTHNELLKNFGISSFPTSFVYSSEQVLLKNYKGVVKPQVLLKDLANQQK